MSVASSLPEEIASVVQGGDALHLLLDYDGTLVPFARLPELARPDEHLIDLLRSIACRRNTHVEIVSGRDRDTLGAWLGHLPITLRAEHGMWLRRPGDREWGASIVLDVAAVARATELVERIALAIGGRVERKRAGAAWHYRGLDVAAEIVDEAAKRLAAETESIGLEVLRGACVVELRARGIHKGHAVHAVVADRPGARIVAVGDDVTDEDMFSALRASDVGVLVGAPHRATAARVRISDVAASRALLAEIAG